MASHAQIDLDHGTVTVGKNSFPKGQWFEFYAALLVRAQDSIYPDELRRIGDWRHKKPSSIGKEVARHLDGLDAESRSLVGCDGKTRAWKLILPPEEVAFRPDREAVSAWLASRSVPAMVSDDWPKILTALVEATTLVQRGSADQALASLEGLDDFGDDRSDVPVAAWVALLKGRAALNADADLLVDIQSRWSKRKDAVGRAVAARLKALWAFGQRFGDVEVGLDMLRHMAAQLESSGDISSLIPVLNILGILERRRDHPEESAALHLRAAVLAGIVGDYQSLQGALFNTALARRAARKKQNLAPDGVCLDLVDLCLLVCHEFGVGRDSAQAETTAARWALRARQTERAKDYLKQAEELLRHIDATFDQAAYKMTHALFSLRPRDADNLRAQIADLRVAEKLFEEAGDLVSARKSAEMRERLEKSWAISPVRSVFVVKRLRSV